jgi:hypothetical protein
MTNYIHTVGQLREALKEHPGDLPIDWYVDTSDYGAREAQGLPILVDLSIIERSDDEMGEAADHIKQRMLFINIG